jgi:hypothetical protein
MPSGGVQPGPGRLTQRTSALRTRRHSGIWKTGQSACRRRVRGGHAHAERGRAERRGRRRTRLATPPPARACRRRACRRRVGCSQPVWGSAARPPVLARRRRRRLGDRTAASSQPSAGGGGAARGTEEGRPGAGRLVRQADLGGSGQGQALGVAEAVGGRGGGEGERGCWGRRGGGGMGWGLRFG